MLNQTVIIEQIRANGNKVMSDILNDLIKDHKIKHDKMISNYNRYQASKAPDGVPIFSRKFDDTSKIDRHINNPFDAGIIDVKLGFMLGNPIIYELDEDKYSDAIRDELTNFNKLNNTEDIDGEVLKMASICGYGARLLYDNHDGEIRIMNVSPWECIFVKDGSLNEAQYAMRYYRITENNKKRVYVEWYDDTNISYYIADESEVVNGIETKLAFTQYIKNGKTGQPHMFDGVPLIQFENNEEHQGDCDKVYESIDAYDRTISDINSEMEQNRLAYMVFFGMMPDKQTREEAKKTGVYGMIGGVGSNDDVKFITKEMHDAAVEHHLDRLEDNIIRGAKSVNFKDEAFGGNVSGVAAKYKMLALESKSIISERKFTAALRSQYKVLATAWKKLGTTIEYLDMKFTWTRNFPVDMLNEAETSLKLKGLISDKTRIGLFSFIDDVEAELQLMEDEEAANPMINLSEPQVDEFGNPITPAVAGVAQEVV